jgi:hypothetical protein
MTFPTAIPTVGSVKMGHDPGDLCCGAWSSWSFPVQLLNEASLEFNSLVIYLLWILGRWRRDRECVCDLALF